MQKDIENVFHKLMEQILFMSYLEAYIIMFNECYTRLENK